MWSINLDGSWVLLKSSEKTVAECVGSGARERAVSMDGELGGTEGTVVETNGTKSTQGRMVEHKLQQQI